MRSLLVVLLGFICICISCTTTKYVDRPVTVETVRTEYVNQLYRDSVFVHDSIDRYISGDTVYQYKYKYLKDTINIKDTIQIPIKITEVKEVNKIYTHQWILIIIGFLALCYLVYKIINLIYNKYGKML